MGRVQNDKIKSVAGRHLSTDNEESESGERATNFLHGTFNPANEDQNKLRSSEIFEENKYEEPQVEADPIQIA